MRHILLEKDNLLEEQTFPHYISLRCDSWQCKTKFKLEHKKDFFFKTTKGTHCHKDH